MLNIKLKKYGIQQIITQSLLNNIKPNSSIGTLSNNNNRISPYQAKKEMSKTKPDFWDKKSNKYDELVKKHDSILPKLPRLPQRGLILF